jgi:cytochrome c
VASLLGTIMFFQPEVAVAAAPAKADGATNYRQRCQICHTAGAKPSTLAPKLNGVAGRKAGATLFAYSAAMKKSGIVWTRPALDKF